MPRRQRAARTLCSRLRRARPLINAMISVVEVHRACIAAGANLVTPAMSTLAELTDGPTGGYADSSDMVAREDERRERPRGERPEQTALDAEGALSRY